MFRNEILNNIIYGNLDESCLNNLIQHDFARLHQEKFLFKRLDMNYHFTMCENTIKGFQSRYHMSVNAYCDLVNLLHDDIAPNEMKSR